jgi:hypothetical protein
VTASSALRGEDFDVLADGKVVGRIYEDASASTPPELRWFWSVTAIVPATPGLTNDTAATREEAMAKFRAAWESRGSRPQPYQTLAKACIASSRVAA